MLKAIIALWCLSIAADAQSLTAFLAPGPWAVCRAYNNPFLCGVWNAQGKPIDYELFASTTDAGIVGFSYTVTGTVNGQPVSRSGMFPVGSAAMLNFGGILSNQQITVSELTAVSTITQ